jgi:hypothetical protein
LLLSAAENGGIVMMARIAVTQALTGRKVAMPELRFVEGAVFLGPLKGTVTSLSGVYSPMSHIRCYDISWPLASDGTHNRD